MVTKVRTTKTTSTTTLTTTSPPPLLPPLAHHLCHPTPSLRATASLCHHPATPRHAPTRHATPRHQDKDRADALHKPRQFQEWTLFAAPLPHCSAESELIVGTYSVASVTVSTLLFLFFVSVSYNELLNTYRSLPTTPFHPPSTSPSPPLPLPRSMAARRSLSCATSSSARLSPPPTGSRAPRRGTVVWVPG